MGCTNGAFDSYGNEVTDNQASWADGQPDFTLGECFYTMKNEENYVYDKPFVQSAGHCSVKRSFVCEKPAVPQNSFTCLSKGFTDLGNKCNGRYDCYDGSDELDCRKLLILYPNDSISEFRYGVILVLL